MLTNKLFLAGTSRSDGSIALCEVLAFVPAIFRGGSWSEASGHKTELGSLSMRCWGSGLGSGGGRGGGVWGLNERRALHPNKQNMKRSSPMSGRSRAGVSLAVSYWLDADEARKTWPGAPKPWISITSRRWKTSTGISTPRSAASKSTNCLQGNLSANRPVCSSSGRPASAKPGRRRYP